MKKGLTAHDGAMLRLAAKQIPEGQVIKLRGVNLGGLRANVERIADAIEQIQTRPASPAYRNEFAEVLDTVLNGRRAPR